MLEPFLSALRSVTRIMLERLRLKKKPKPPPMTKSEFLKLKPVRNPLLKWEKDEKGEIRLIVPRSQILAEEAKKGAPEKIVKKVFPAPPPPVERRIHLDKLGSTVWELCDGKNTVKEIVNSLHEKYKMMPAEAEISLDTYFRQLSKRGLLGFILPEEMQEKFKEETKDKDVKK